MQRSDKILCLFTAEFPYGNKSETFLETEILFLSQGFREVHVFTSTKSQFIRILPENVKVVDDFSNLNFSKKDKIAAMFGSPFLLLRILFDEMKDKGLLRILRNKNVLFEYLSTQLIIGKKLVKYFSNGTGNHIFYDYWFCNRTLALSLMSERDKDFRFISRGHGYDIYDERWGDCGIPFRSWKMKKINAIYIISQFGKEYMKGKIDTEVREKVKVSYLGVLKHAADVKIEGRIPTIVSCSSMVPFKNINRIVELLNMFDSPIKWIHFGDGSERLNIEAACSQLPSHVEYELKGHVENPKLIEFYQNNKVDVFLSMSESEGLPVSMMEALSFNVPVVAVPVGGIPELVIDGLTGFLLNTPEDLAACYAILNSAIKFPFEKSRIEIFFNKHFNAENNYKEFIKYLN